MLLLMIALLVLNYFHAGGGNSVVSIILWTLTVFFALTSWGAVGALALSVGVVGLIFALPFLASMEIMD